MPATLDSAHPSQQAGGASLWVSLALIIASLTLSLAVAHSIAMEQRMARNNVLLEQARWAAMAGLNFAAATLQQTRPDWLPAPTGVQQASVAQNPPLLYSQGGDSFAVNITYQRALHWNGYIFTQASAAAASSPEIEVQVSQFQRPLGVLSPAGEAAPPLVVDGCAQLRAAIELLPWQTDRGAAGTALASSGAADCTQLGQANVQAGQVRAQAFPADGMWDYLFAVGREEFRALAAADRQRPAPQRNYWWARATDLRAGQWRTSLGSVEQPVILLIPRELGCIAFGGGARIIGLVFIEAPCGQGPAWGPLRLYGSLALAGETPRFAAGSQLSHISHATATPALSRPWYIEPPPLDVIRVAGSWRDF